MVSHQIQKGKENPLPILFMLNSSTLLDLFCPRPQHFYDSNLPMPCSSILSQYSIKEFFFFNQRILKEPRIFHSPKSEVLSHVDKCSNNTPWLYLKSINLSLNSTKYLLSIYHREGMIHIFLQQILVR